MPKSKSDDPSKKKLDVKVSMQKHEQKYLQKTTGKSAAEVSNAANGFNTQRHDALFLLTL
jgi:uncharacterized protein YbbC (DUF1343 family)